MHFADDRSVRALGELGLIARIASMVGSSAARVGVGDDTAVLDIPGDEHLLATVDMLVDNVHFVLHDSDPRSVGRRAFEVNASDIGSMGGAPTFALVSLALPSDLPVSFVDGLYEGMLAAARRHGASIVGGNVSRIAGPAVIDLTLLGAVPKNDLVTRAGARVGDVLALTGTIGDAAAARLLRTMERNPPDIEIVDWLKEHEAPSARVAQGQALARAHLAHAMIDLSDGISSDLRHLCEAGGVGAVLDEESLPISHSARWAADRIGVEILDLALSGGEDYELLVALDPGDLASARKAAPPLTPIGRVAPSAEGVRIRRRDGTIDSLDASGWTHF